MEKQELLKAQVELCKKNSWPHFAPSDGRCYYCGQNCVHEKWATELITGCKLCHKSFCD